MSDIVMLVVLGAALLHASWNAIVKGGQDKQLNMVAVVLGHVLPAALVTALRETSIVFALLIGVVHLKERLSLIKIVSTFTTLCGAAILRFAR